ncbi:MAG: hypothetical protein AAGA40_06305 [Cyanobacteria bacterium P01_E01_bin.45]
MRSPQPSPAPQSNATVHWHQQANWQTLRTDYVAPLNEVGSPNLSAST